MSFEEEFDRKIKMKMDEAAFPFDPANWEKASAMLDASRGAGVATAAPKKWYLPAALLGIATIGLAIYFWPEAGKQQPQAVLSESTGNTELSVQKTDKTNTNTATTTTDNSNKLIPPATNVAPILVENTRATDNATSPKNTNTQTHQLANTENLAVGNRPLNTEVRQNRQAEVRNQQAQQQAQEINTGLAATTKAERPSGMQPIASNNNSPDTPEQTQARTSNESASAPVSKQNTTGNNTGAWAAQVPQKSSEPQLTEPQSSNRVSESGTTVQQEDYLVVYPLLQSNSSYMQNENQLRETKFVLLKRYDDDYYHNRHAPKNYFVNVEGGAFYNFGWMVANTRDGKGINAYAGVNYAHHLTKKSAAGIGLQIVNLGHVSQPFYKGATTTFDFYAVSTGTSIVAQNTTFLSFPFRFYYLPNKLTQVGAGISGNYMLQTQNRYTITSTHTDITDTKSSTVEKGVYANANRLTLQASVFYVREVIPGLSVKAEYAYGLTDLYKNTGGINSTERLHGIKAGIIFTFIK